MQLFPFRTTSMLLSFFLNISVSYLTKYLFTNSYVSKRFDIFKCFNSSPIEIVALKDSTTVDEFSKLNVNCTIKYGEHDERNDSSDERGGTVAGKADLDTRSTNFD